MSYKDGIPEKRRTIFVHVDDPQLPASGGRLALIREVKVSDDTQNVSGIRCSVCGFETRVLSSDIRNCDLFWCSQDCFKKQPWRANRIPVVKKNDIGQEVKTCEKCGGPARGRGFAHTDDCPEVLAKTSKKTCPECGGPAKGRGFKHEENCSLKTQPYVPKAQREENSNGS